MGAILLAAAAIWGVGMATRTPNSTRWIGIGILYLAVLLMHLVLPVESGLRQSTGKSIGPWLILGGAFALFWAYKVLLRTLKLKAGKDQKEPHASPMTSEIERNARHIVLREIGGPGQKRLKEAKVLVIGAGGIGSPVLSYLAAAGVGTIGVIDGDMVDNSNLQRQIIHNDADIGIPKVQSAKAAMEAQNPYVSIRPYHRRLTEDIAEDLIADYDLVLDGTDNFDTRYLVNRASVATETPLISGALTQWEGQLSVFDPANGAPCYECVFPTRPAEGLVPSCSEAGVIGPLPGVIGTMMAVEAIKIIAQAGEPLRNRLLMYDALYAETRIIKINRVEDCNACGRPTDAAISK